MTETNPELGAEIAAARKAAGLSKEAAAKKANVSTTTLRRAEAGERLQGHKLAAIMTAVGIPAFYSGVEPDEDDEPFTLPPRIERGYTATVDFSRAVAEEVPELAQRATRLMLDASALFAEAGDVVFKRTPSGGDGDADNTGGSAPTKLRPVDPLEVDEAAYDPEGDKDQ
jgi:transcriptional regulator with XRE-family HTH domain